MDPKRITIVIVSFNTKDLLRSCVRSIMENMDMRTDEIMVVDNASTDGSVGMMQEEFCLKQRNRFLLIPLFFQNKHCKVMRCQYPKDLVVLCLLVHK